MVSTIRIPTITNATEFSSYIMEKRRGLRIDYDEQSFPNSRSEINDRLLVAEASVTKLMNTAWRVTVGRQQLTWTKYRGGSRFSRSIRSYLFNTPVYNMPLTLLFNPVISVTKLEIIISNAAVDLIASADYTEGWANSYYIDYHNGIITFRSIKPSYNTPVYVEYTYGRTEDNDGVVIAENDITNITETTITTTANTLIRQGQYDGKLLKITSGVNSGATYRIHTSELNGATLTLNLLSGYTLVSDGVLNTDTYEIYSVPYDIKEMIWLHAFLGILVADPTYQYNFTNPFEEPAPQYAQFEWLAGRFNSLLAQRKQALQLLN